jgi:2-iminoacetate synthase ThiH
MLSHAGRKRSKSRRRDELHELRRIIRDAGVRPAQRDTLYQPYFLN